MVGPPRRAGIAYPSPGTGCSRAVLRSAEPDPSEPGAARWRDGAAPSSGPDDDDGGMSDQAIDEVIDNTPLDRSGFWDEMSKPFYNPHPQNVTDPKTPPRTTDKGKGKMGAESDLFRTVPFSM